MDKNSSKRILKILHEWRKLKFEKGMKNNNVLIYQRGNRVTVLSTDIDILPYIQSQNLFNFEVSINDLRSGKRIYTLTKLDLRYRILNGLGFNNSNRVKNSIAFHNRAVIAKTSNSHQTMIYEISNNISLCVIFDATKGLVDQYWTMNPDATLKEVTKSVSKIVNDLGGLEYDML